MILFADSEGLFLYVSGSEKIVPLDICVKRRHQSAFKTAQSDQTAVRQKKQCIQ